MVETRATKVTVVGVGKVGASVAFALAAGGLATELVLIDSDRRRAEVQARDLSDAAAFVKPVQVRAADYPDSVGSGVVIFSAGVLPAAGRSGLDLARRNLEVLRQAFPRVLRYCPEAIFVIVTNPVDVLTYAANRMADVGEERVLGSGTVLESSRLRSLLARQVRVDPRNVHAYVVGEHGASEVALWSRASVAGIPLDDYCRHYGLPLVDRAECFERVVRAGEDILAEGTTQYAISIAVARIVEAVLRDERSVLTVSGMLEGVYGIEGPNCFSLPALVDAGGRRRPLPLTLAPDELEAIRRSAKRLKEMHRALGLA